MQEIRRTNGEDKPDDLISARARLISTLKGHVSRLEADEDEVSKAIVIGLHRAIDDLEAPAIYAKANGHDPSPPLFDARDPSSIKVRLTPKHRTQQRNIDAEIAAAARCSVGQVKLARKLYRRGREDLCVAVMLHALPVGTAARIGVPKKVNRLVAERDRLIEMLAP
jgi:hypothetical protein